MRKVVLASRNKGKLAELGQMLAPLGLEVVGAEEFPDLEEIEETGATFAENAMLKARHVASKTGLIAIADDSGLACDALDGAPGVFSARYGDDWEKLAGETRDQRNMRKLLRHMRDVPPDRRACHFETAIVAAAPDGPALIATGKWHGSLLDAPRGENGFGYDPIFLDPATGKSAAELSQAEKNALSHRGKALRQLLEHWSDFAALAGA